jgi:anti-sigma regulatory factor (Ser/Thr protein kinase)
MTERTITLPADLSSVRRARLFARDVVCDWGFADLADDVQLGTSELITNAVKHAGTQVLLTLSLGTVLTVEAHDAEPQLRRPAGEQGDPMAASGRGLHIIAAISSDWGIRQSPRGKAVWFTLPLPAADRPDADVVSLDGHRPAERQAPEQQESSAARGQLEARAGARAAC